jgi:hypothetical protein
MGIYIPPEPPRRRVVEFLGYFGATVLLGAMLISGLTLAYIVGAIVVWAS